LGYTFLGWATSSTATSASYYAGGTFTLDGTRTLYAVWQAATVKITWNAGIGSVSLASSTKTVGTALGTLPTSTVPNVTFDGWYTASTGGSKISPATLTPSSNTTYYARWDLSTENGKMNLLVKEIKAKFNSTTQHFTDETRLNDVELGVITAIIRDAVDTVGIPMSTLADMVRQLGSPYAPWATVERYLNNVDSFVEYMAGISTFRDSFYVGMAVGDVMIVGLGLGVTAKGLTELIAGIVTAAGGTIGSVGAGAVLAIPAGITISATGVAQLTLGICMFASGVGHFGGDVEDALDETALNREKATKKINELKEKADPVRTTASNTDMFNSKTQGGFREAKAEFDKLAGNRPQTPKPTNHGTTYLSQLDDGTKINLHWSTKSNEGWTIEIERRIGVSGSHATKIRFGGTQ
jgi:uncharacterized repeat protein (TIGR02543 family)